MSLVRAIDVADGQPRDLSGLIATYQPVHCIIHLYSVVESPPWEHSAAQIASAQANGCSVGGYVFLYPGADHVRALNSVLDRCASIGLVLPILWLDVEEYQGENLTTPELARAVNHLEALQTPAGIYTSREMWSRLGNPTGFEDVPVWAAQWNNQPNLDGLLPIPNLPKVVAHQYTDTPLDQSVILAEYAELPAPDPCADLKAAIRAELARKRLSRKRLAALVG